MRRMMVVLLAILILGVLATEMAAAERGPIFPVEMSVSGPH
jgi:hypothetical protein